MIVNIYIVLYSFISFQAQDVLHGLFGLKFVNLNAEHQYILNNIIIAVL